CVTDEHDCKNLLPMVAIMQYIYATRNAFISRVMCFVAQTNVCAMGVALHRFLVDRKAQQLLPYRTHLE
ncbi:MAG: hypothetical protein ACMG51_09740, partial [Ginsengibacter sp.]